MDEQSEAQQQTTRKAAAMFSAALSAAEIGMQLSIQRAEEATRGDRERQAAATRQLAVERDTAAVQWQRVRDPELWRSGDPQDLARVMASAATWETLDPRAARAWQTVEKRLRSAGVTPQGWQHARESDDLVSMALLLQRSEETSAEIAPTGHEASVSRAAEATAFPAGTERAVSSGPDPEVRRTVENALDPDTAARVLRGHDSHGLARELDRARGVGHDPVVLLGAVAGERSLGDAGDYSAVLTWRMQRHLNMEGAPSADEVATGEAAEPAAAEPAVAAVDVEETQLQQAANMIAASEQADPGQLQRRMGIKYGEAHQLLEALQQQGLVGPDEGMGSRAVLARPDPDAVRQAGELVTTQQFGSASMLQRRMQISGAEADGLLNDLHRQGVVGPRDGNLAREVLIRPDELDQHLDARSVGVGAREHERDAAADDRLSHDLSATAERSEQQAEQGRASETTVDDGAQKTDVDRNIAGAEQSADRLHGAAEAADRSAGAHQDRAEGLGRLAYENGAEAPRLAGEAFPDTPADALAKGQSQNKGQRSGRRNIKWAPDVERRR